MNYVKYAIYFVSVVLIYGILSFFSIYYVGRLVDAFFCNDFLKYFLYCLIAVLCMVVNPILTYILVNKMKVFHF